MYGKRTYRKRRPAVKKARRVPRKSGVARKSITKLVKSVIRRQAEKKEAFDYGVNNVITTTVTSTPVFRNVLPTLAQGVQTSQRIGNEIKVVSGYIKGHVNILPYNVTTNPGPTPAYIKMWLVTCKTINTVNLASTSIATTFFDITNGTVGLQGNMLDIDLPINNDVWTLHASKTIKIGVGGAAAASTGYYDNSSFTAPFYFNTGKYMNTLKYDDGASNNPTNRNLFLIFQAVSADGTTFTGANSAEYHFSNKVTYIDM